MPLTVSLKALHHRGGERIGLCYEHYKQLDQIVRKLPGVKWSQTNCCWYVPLSETSYQTITLALKELAVNDHELLKQYLIKRKRPCCMDQL